MKNLFEKAKYVLDGEDGASNVEIIVWMSVVLIIATVLYLFKDSVVEFVKRVIGRVDGLGVA